MNTRTSTGKIRSKFETDSFENSEAVKYASVNKNLWKKIQKRKMYFYWHKSWHGVFIDLNFLIKYRKKIKTNF